MRLLPVFLFFILLQGCASIEKPKTISVDQPTVTVKYVSPPMSLLESCNITKPPEKVMYKTLTPVEKERALAELVAHLYDDLSDCNMRIKGVKSFFEEVGKVEKDGGN